MADWNPEKYLRFAAERAQPALDLMSRLTALQPRNVCDLGCGPGNSTALLAQAFPDAKITGVDSSPAMLVKARQACPKAEFFEADVSTWQPPNDVDLVFSNALFQWVPHHAEVMLRICKTLKPGAALAVQMPDNLQEPSHRLMVETAQRGAWFEKLAQAVTARSATLSPTGYHNLFSAHVSRFDVWRSTYYHLLDSHQGIVAMLSTTGLKPFLDPLDENERSKFLTHYVASLADHYPLTENGNVLYPFPRLFLIAVSAGS